MNCPTPSVMVISWLLIDMLTVVVVVMLLVVVVIVSVAVPAKVVAPAL